MIRKKQSSKKAKNTQKTLYGDTIVEAVVAIAIYSIVAVLALGSMSSGLSTAQRNLESSMSRAIIDSQSDTLRYFYEGYISTRSGASDDSFYKDIWKEIKPKSGPHYPAGLDETDHNSCAELMEEDYKRVDADNPHSAGEEGLTIFALSGRGAISSAKDELDTTSIYGFGKFDNKDGYIRKQIIRYDEVASASNIIEAPLYPRITYKNMNEAGTTIDDTNSNAIDFLNGAGGKDEGGNSLYQSRVAHKAEGVWIYPKRTNMGYDFYVRTCWNPVGSSMPSTFTSVVRLYDAE